MISGNGAAYGGGIGSSDSSPLIEDNIIIDNLGKTSGGGISSHGGASDIRYNTIIGNRSWTGGGIASRFYGTQTIAENFIALNEVINYYPGSTLGGGGGIRIHDSSPIVVNNTVVNNTSELTGGGITCDRGGTLLNNTIAGNTSAQCGGGIFCFHSSSIIESNTITGNSSTIGGGIGMAVNANPTITSTIMWDNSSANGKEIFVGSDWIGYSIPSTLTISYSDVEGGMASVLVDSGCTLDWGDGMIDDNPFFVMPDASDCRLLWESPCIDTGHPDSLDADGTRKDMGAHFFNQDDYLTLYVTPDAMWVTTGDKLGVTYTAINRWGQAESLWLLSQILLPGGSSLDIVGPDQYTLPANYTAQAHINHPAPLATPTGKYEYLSQISDSEPLQMLYDDDSFEFLVFK
jgi:hypothetical protein